VLVYTSAREFLMLQRLEPAGFWQSVTGSLKWGESPRLAALRELAEETSIQAGSLLVDLHQRVSFPIIEPWKPRYSPDAHFNTEYWFCLQLASRRLIRPNPAEHKGYRWLPQQQAARLATSWTNRDAILSIP